MSIKIRLNLNQKVLSVDGSSLNLDNSLEKAEFEKKHGVLILEYEKEVNDENTSIYSWIQNFENGHHFNIHCDDYGEKGSVIGLWRDDKNMNVEITNNDKINRKY